MPKKIVIKELEELEMENEPGKKKRWEWYGYRPPSWEEAGGYSR